MKEEDLIHSLETIKLILDEKKIDYWLDAGTLLGAIREKRFLPWDYDIDLGAWYQDIDRILKANENISKKNFELIYFPLEKCIKILGNNSEIDINLYEKKGTNATRKWYVNNKKGEILDYFRWVLKTKNPELKRSKIPKKITRFIHIFCKILTKKIREQLVKKIIDYYKKSGCKIITISIPIKYFTSLKEIKFYNLNIKAPTNSEKYLEFRYGKDWKIPNKDYVYYKDDKSIV